MPSPGGGLDPEFDRKIRALIAASGGKVTIRSGYRSVAEQQRLWSAAVKKYGSEAAARKWVAPPGKSNHNRGVAVDLGGDLSLAHRLAPQFGLTFPMGHEPWHVEPAGARGVSAGHTHVDPATGPPAPVGAGSDPRSAAYQLNSLIKILGADDEEATNG